VLHLRNTTGYGAIYGAEQCILGWVDEMRRQGGVEFHAGCFVGRGGGSGEFLAALEERSVSVEVIRMRHWAALSVVRRLEALIRERRIDVVHSHENRSHILGTMAARRAGVAAVATLHGYTYDSWRSGLWARVNAWFLRRGGVDRIVTPSHALRRRLVRESRFPAETVTVPNGIALPRGAREEGNGDFRGSLGVDPRARVVGVLGRLSREKGHAVLLDAIPAITRTHPRTAFVFAGDGPERERLVEHARRLRIDDRVKFLGWRADVPVIMRSLDLLVLPSMTEGLPMVVLEGMARGLPVVASRVGGVPEAVVSGETGILVPAGDPHSLASAVSALLDAPEKAREMGEHGVRRVRECFSLARSAESLRRIYEAAVAHAAARPRVL
jgi:glycosyltransferase involved in cell wall biosynthesis